MFESVQGKSKRTRRFVSPAIIRRAGGAAVANLVNEGTTDRVIRIVLGLVLGFVATRLHGAGAVILYILGALSFLTGVTGVCLLYMAFGIRTCPARTSAQTRT
jgi:hypothetical protein